ncbi:727_t:CDS:1, partial [Dentiscutata heterogama]
IEAYYQEEYQEYHSSPLNDETEMMLLGGPGILRFFYSSKSLPGPNKVPDDAMMISIVDDYDKTFHQHYSKFKGVQLKEYVYDN